MGWERIALLGAALLLAAQRAAGAIVTLEVAEGLPARADYVEGDPGKPALLMLHGFLQTHEFRTIRRLAEGLRDEGYTVLSPTLSLGIPMRKQSLACEAIHTHTLDDAHREIGAWVSWLRARGHQSVVLVGHSSGSMVLLSYLYAYAGSPVIKLVAISLMEGRWELDRAEHERLQASLRAQIAAGDNPLISHDFSFCKPLRATARSLLSYVEWTPDRILNAIDRVPTELVLILGSRDKRLGPDWLRDLREIGRPLDVIEGANHFMDGEFEFELLDRVVNALP